VDGLSFATGTGIGAFNWEGATVSETSAISCSFGPRDCRATSGICAENSHSFRVFPQFAQRKIDMLFVQPAFVIQVKRYCHGRSALGRDSNFVRFTPCCASASRQRASAPFLCAGRQQEGSLMWKAGVGLHRLAGDSDEAGVILFLIGDVSLDHCNP